MKRVRNLIIFLFSALLLTYIVIRANALSFTHDESLSFTITEGKKIWAASANNHQLNTFLMSQSKSLFGAGEFSLRLPNVLAFVLYLLGSFLIFGKSKGTSNRNWLFLFALSVALLNPFVLEFFSLARGYGLSLACMMMGMYFMIRNEKPAFSSAACLQNLAFAAAFAALATYANLALINFYISILMVFALKYLLVRRQAKSSRFDLLFVGIFLLACIPLYVDIQHLLDLNARKQLYAGAVSFAEGFEHLIKSSIYYRGYARWIIPTVKITVILSFLLGAASLIWKKKINGPFFATALLSTFILIGLYLEHVLFDAKFPMGRTAMFYVPMIAVFLYHLLVHVAEEYHLKKIYYLPLLIGLMIPLFMNVIASVNFKYTRIWRYDANTKHAMQRIQSHIQQADSMSSISNHWMLEPAINYYITTWGLKLHPATRKGVQLTSDFIYRYKDQATVDQFQSLEYYEDTKSELLIKKPDLVEDKIEIK